MLLQIQYIAVWNIQSFMVYYYLQLQIKYQLMEQQRIINKLIQCIANCQNFQRIVRQANRKYFFKQNILKINFPDDIFGCLAKLQTSYPEQFEKKQDPIKVQQPTNQKWETLQYKIFSSISVFYSIILEKNISMFVKNQISILYKIFSNKSQTFIDYNLHALIKISRTKKSDWNMQESRQLSQIVRKNQTKIKWNHISYKLFTQSKGVYFKTPQQCRQKWSNYLNPVIQKTRWSKEEDIELCRLVQKYGTKWAMISKMFLVNRNEHMAKNRYRSLTKNLKYINKDILKRIINNKHNDKAQVQVKAYNNHIQVHQVAQIIQEKSADQKYYIQQIILPQSKWNQKIKDSPEVFKISQEKQQQRFTKNNVCGQQQINMYQIYEHFNSDIYYYEDNEKYEDNDRMELIVLNQGEEIYNFTEVLSFNKASLLCQSRILMDLQI